LERRETPLRALLETRIGFEEALHDAVAFFTQDRAHRIKKRSAHANARRRHVQYGELDLGETPHVLATSMERDVGAPPQCSRSRAGGIDEDAIVIVGNVRASL